MSQLIRRANVGVLDLNSLELSKEFFQMPAIGSYQNHFHYMFGAWKIVEHEYVTKELTVASPLSAILDHQYNLLFIYQSYEISNVGKFEESVLFSDQHVYGDLSLKGGDLKCYDLPEKFIEERYEF